MNDRNNSRSTNGEQDTQRGVARWLTREILGVVFAALLLFLSAGRFDWPMGWALVAIYALWTAANAYLLIPTNPELLAERASRGKGEKSWDSIILSFIGIYTLVKYIVAGLDLRYGWSAPLPLWLQLTALVLAALGYALSTWAMVSNDYFALVNRIQDERGHSVAKAGPYRFVRHPAYIGSIIFELVSPILLGSLWALIPGLLSAILIVVRTAMEDRSLHRELPGYRSFSQQTRYRLLPGIW